VGWQQQWLSDYGDGLNWVEFDRSLVASTYIKKRIWPELLPCSSLRADVTSEHYLVKFECSAVHVYIKLIQFKSGAAANSHV